jgi:hypothetical protein
VVRWLVEEVHEEAEVVVLVMDNHHFQHLRLASSSKRYVE